MRRYFAGVTIVAAFDAVVVGVGGAIFGMVGLVLGAPLLSAAFHISDDLARAKAALAATDGAPDDVRGPGPPGDAGADPFAVVG